MSAPSICPFLTPPLGMGWSLWSLVSGTQLCDLGFDLRRPSTSPSGSQKDLGKWAELSKWPPGGRELVAAMILHPSPRHQSKADLVSTEASGTSPGFGIQRELSQAQSQNQVQGPLKSDSGHPHLSGCRCFHPEAVTCSALLHSLT